MRSSVTAALAFALVGLAFATPGVSPASVTKKVDPGSSFKIDKIVTTPAIPPKPDVIFLVDVTSSMGSAISNIKANLDTVISTVTSANAQFAVASFGDLADPNGFQVNQPLTSSVPLVKAAVNSLTAQLGRDIPEDWINALYKLATGAVTFRAGSSRVIVLVGDAPSHDPSGGHTLANAIAALKAQSIRVIGVNVLDLDSTGQATAVTTATGGVIIGTAANAVSSAIISGLKNLDATVKPDVVSCDAGVTVSFDPANIEVGSGTSATFHEAVKVAGNAVQDTTLRCSVRFLLNGAAGGDAFTQSITLTVNRIGCDTCDPNPGKNLCHITTSCAPTPFGTMCLTRPGYKADGAGNDDTKVQWRMKWPGHEHRVAVKPGKSADTLCDSKYTGPDVCKEVAVADCSKGALENVRYDNDQIVIGDGEL